MMTHDCEYSAVLVEETTTQTHGFSDGLYERWTERFWHCQVCGCEVDSDTEGELL